MSNTLFPDVLAEARTLGFCQGEGLNLLFVNFLQRVSGCEGVVGAKDRGL